MDMKQGSSGSVVGHFDVAGSGRRRYDLRTKASELRRVGLGERRALLMIVCTVTERRVAEVMRSTS
jgi:hypothetical protein